MVLNVEQIDADRMADIVAKQKLSLVDVAPAYLNRSPWILAREQFEKCCDVVALAVRCCASLSKTITNRVLPPYGVMMTMGEVVTKLKTFQE